MNGRTQEILEVLEPKIGRSLAESLLRIKCRKNGISPDNIPSDSIPLLADDLYEPLNIFAGEEFAKDLTSRIKAISAS